MSIVQKVKSIATEQVKDSNYSLYDVEYVKEGSDYFLRVYFDKDGGLSLDDCVLLSEKLADELDKEDFISDKYYLEVSSPGTRSFSPKIASIFPSLTYTYLVSILSTVPERISPSYSLYSLNRISFSASRNL